MAAWACFGSALDQASWKFESDGISRGHRNDGCRTSEIAVTKKVLALASAGGHWQQLMLLRPAYAQNDVLYLTTLEGLADQFDAKPAMTIPDCNRNTPFKLVSCAFVLLVRILRFRPDVVISTGALPGVLALAIGRALGARTIWVDSVANAEEMSSSGRMARRFAHLRLSQWKTPAEAEGAEYAGSLL